MADSCILTEEMLASLVAILRQANHAVALTGAGISTLSGIPDFRGPQGLYKRSDIDANRLFDTHEFRRDPTYYYRNAADFLYDLDDIQPGVVHRVLARLEEQGIIKAVITQNIDMLHQKAGSVRVLELHGSPQWHHCLQCCAAYPFADVAPAVLAGDIPYCASCGGSVKPDIVFFGDMLPSDTLDQAEDEALRADVLLILGTSLTVYPAAAIPEIAMRHGCKLAMVNASPTHLDKHSVWHSTSLEAVFNALDGIY